MLCAARGPPRPRAGQGSPHWTTTTSYHVGPRLVPRRDQPQQVSSAKGQQAARNQAEEFDEELAARAARRDEIDCHNDNKDGHDDDVPCSTNLLQVRAIDEPPLGMLLVRT